MWTGRAGSPCIQSPDRARPAHQGLVVGALVVGALLALLFACSKSTVPPTGSEKGDPTMIHKNHLKVTVMSLLSDMFSGSPQQGRLDRDSAVSFQNVNLEEHAQPLGTLNL